MYKFKTKGTCAQEITFDIKDNKIYNIKFYGGCNGNLKAISKLLEGEDCQRVIDILEGNTCGPRSTSCADQLTKAVKKALANELEEI